MNHGLFTAQIASNIITHGQHLIWVIAEQDQPSFSYTIGNHDRDLPELLMFGGSPEKSAWLLNELGKMMRGRDRAFEGGEIVNLGGQFGVKIVTANDPRTKTNYTCQVGRFFRTEAYSVQQVLIPDPDGIYPDDPRCDEAYKRPVLRLIRMNA